MSNIETLTQQRAELEKKVDEVQVHHAEHLFEVDFEDRKTVKLVMDHLDKGFTWKTQNAAVIVTLYDNLKKQYKELATSDSKETGTAVVSLRAHELNGLYQALLSVEGTGVENARRFIRMLTLVGETVTNAMKVLGEMNQEIKDLHVELSKLDSQIDELEKANNTEVVEPVLEETETTEG